MCHVPGCVHGGWASAAAAGPTLLMWAESCPRPCRAPQGLALPQGRSVGSSSSAEGVWVLGLIGGSAADAAGLQQGDQLLEVDGRHLTGDSPFSVASLLAGQEAAADAPASLGLQDTAVQIKVRPCCLPAVASYCGGVLRAQLRPPQPPYSGMNLAVTSLLAFRCRSPPA